MYKTTPDTIFVFGFRSHFSGGKTNGLSTMILWIVQRRMNLDKDSEEMTFMGRGRAPANEERNTKPGWRSRGLQRTVLVLVLARSKRSGDSAGTSAVWWCKFLRASKSQNLKIILKKRSVCVANAHGISCSRAQTTLNDFFTAENHYNLPLNYSLQKCVTVFLTIVFRHKPSTEETALKLIWRHLCEQTLAIQQ